MAEYTEAIGRRKTSTARVRLYPGTGDIIVNDKPMNVYFGRALDQMILRQPLTLTGTDSAYNISVRVRGGGEGRLADPAQRQQSDRDDQGVSRGRRRPGGRGAPRHIARTL